MQDKLRLWSPFNRNDKLVGVRDDTSSLVKEQNNLSQALAKHWAGAFQVVKSTCSEDAAKAYAERFATRFDFSRFQVLSSQQIGTFVHHVNDTGLGPDGIRYIGWREACDFADHVLHKVATWRAMGLHMAIDHNDLLIVFPPKGISDGDGKTISETGGVARNLSETRPLGLQNTDAKAVDGA